MRRGAEWGTIVDELKVVVGVPVDVFVSCEGVEVVDTGKPSRARTINSGIVDAGTSITKGANKGKDIVERESIECNKIPNGGIDCIEALLASLGSWNLQSDLLALTMLLWTRGQNKAWS